MHFDYSQNSQTLQKHLCVFVQNQQSLFGTIHQTSFLSLFMPLPQTIPQTLPGRFFLFLKAVLHIYEEYFHVQ